MLLNYEQIRMDGGTQPRAALQIEVMEDYAELMRAGVKFPPLVVFHDGKDYWLADGFHRIGAALRAFPDSPIEVEVHQGTLQEAQWYSFGVNKTHGLRRTREDLQRAIKAALRHPEAAKRSDSELAEHIGMSHSTVAKYRAELGATCQIGKSSRQSGKNSKSSPVAQQSQDAADQPRLRTGRDGRTINTSKIGRNPNRKAMKPRSPAEFAEARRDGFRGRAPSMIKLELPNNHVHNCAFDLLEHFTFQYLEKVFQAIVTIHQQREEKESNV
jgi:hypothetical protein